MAADMNMVALVGRLTRDPELRHTPTGDGVVNMRLAVSGRGRDDSGQWVDKPNFFDVVVFGRQAENVARFLGKGRRVGVQGRLQWREWTAQDGSQRQSVEVVAADVSFLDSVPDDQRGVASRAVVSDMPAALPVAAPVNDDDIPF